MKLLTKAFGFFDHLLNFFNWLACVLVGFVTLIISADVVSRQFLGRPIIWVTEISEYSLLWITFLASAWLLREEGHIRIDLLVKFLNQRCAHMLDAITSTVGAVICLIVAWYGAEVVWDHFERCVPSIEMLGIPRYLILGIVPVGSFLLFLQFLRGIHKNLEKWRMSKKNL